MEFSRSCLCTDSVTVSVATASLEPRRVIARLGVKLKSHTAEKKGRLQSRLWSVEENLEGFFFFFFYAHLGVLYSLSAGHLLPKKKKGACRGFNIAQVWWRSLCGYRSKASDKVHIRMGKCNLSDGACVGGLEYFRNRIYIEWYKKTKQNKQTKKIHPANNSSAGRNSPMMKRRMARLARQQAEQQKRIHLVLLRLQNIIQSSYVRQLSTSFLHYSQITLAVSIVLLQSFSRNVNKPCTQPLMKRPCALGGWSFWNWSQVYADIP